LGRNLSIRLADFDRRSGVGWLFGPKSRPTEPVGFLGASEPLRVDGRVPVDREFRSFIAVSDTQDRKGGWHAMPTDREQAPGGKVRYAVVGLGWISQEAMLPAFANAKENSELTALVSSDPEKLRELGEAYGVELRYSYDEFDQCLRSGRVDAVYIGLPNDMHREYTEHAARAGVHVLCEKPMANSEDECAAMIRAAEENHVRLMIAYRLHFEEANMKAGTSAWTGPRGAAL
jgi:hypothetical protein